MSIIKYSYVRKESNDPSKKEKKVMIKSCKRASSLVVRAPEFSISQDSTPRRSELEIDLN